MDQYALHTAAAVTLEVAHLVTGVTLCFLGKSLLEKGVRGDFLGEGALASKKIRVLTSSPGIVFLLAGLVVITTAVYRQSEFVQTARDAARPTSAGPTTIQTTSRFMEEPPAAVVDSGGAPESVRVVRGLATILAAAHPNPSESYGNADGLVARIRQARGDGAELRRSQVIAAIDEIAREQPAILPQLVLDPAFGWLLSDDSVVKSLHVHLSAQVAQSLMAPAPRPR